MCIRDRCLHTAIRSTTLSFPLYTLAGREAAAVGDDWEGCDLSGGGGGVFAFVGGEGIVVDD